MISEAFLTSPLHRRASCFSEGSEAVKRGEPTFRLIYICIRYARLPGNRLHWLHYFTAQAFSSARPTFRGLAFGASGSRNKVPVYQFSHKSRKRKDLTASRVVRFTEQRGIERRSNTAAIVGKGGRIGAEVKDRGIRLDPGQPCANPAQPGGVGRGLVAA